MNITHNKVYADNLAVVTTERELMDLLSPFGNVAEVNIAVDRVNHKSRGFGFPISDMGKGPAQVVACIQ